MQLDGDVARERIARVFRFLQAFHQIRNPVPRAVSEQWHMWLDSAPATPFTWFAGVSDAESESSDSDENGSGLVLRVRRPKLSECPAPPVVLEGWVQDGWRNPEQATRTIATRPVAPGDSRQEAFGGSKERVEAFKKWDARRSSWRATELPARQADQLFQTLYSLHGQLRRESERFELVLGDGNLVWRRADGDAHHPVVLQTVQLEFDPDRPEFRITETDREVELYTALLSCFEEVDARRIAECRDEVVSGGAHPLLGQVTNGFLKRLALTMSGKGVLAGDTKPEVSDYPQFYRRPVLFLRPRAVGFARVLEGILADIEAGAALPKSLERIVGIERTASNGDGEARLGASEVLLSKPANPEQINIVQRLHDHGSVLVQGPPGTGKSHTIANLIGHLLAHGKSVLVTSHTTKALNVLRGKVVDDLRPLCVSVLENDVESRRELEQAVTSIADRLARSDRDRLAAESRALGDERARLVVLLEKARAALRDARSDEQREVVVAGSRWSPCEAAKVVAAGTKADAWVPGPCAPGAPLPLSSAELDELYRTNGTLSQLDEQLLAEPLPELEALALPDAFESLIQRLAAPVRHPDSAEMWDRPPSGTQTKSVEDVGSMVVAEAATLSATPAWQQAAALAGMNGTGSAQPWESLARLIDEASEVDASHAELLMRFDVVLPHRVSPDECERVAQELLTHIEQEGEVGFFARLTNRAWAGFLKSATVSGARPRTADHFRALLATARLARLRVEIGRRWQRMMEAAGAPGWSELGNRPELGCAQYSAEIRRLLGWRQNRVGPLLEQLRSLGLKLEMFLEAQPPVTGERAALARLLRALGESLPPVLNGRVEAGARALDDAAIQRLSDTLKAGPGAGTRLQTALGSAVAARDAAKYRAVFEQSARLKSLQKAIAIRKGLLERLQAVAPRWAESVRLRVAPHHAPTPPGDAARAWVWHQLHSELERRANKSFPELQARVEKLEQQLRDVTVKLIDRRAWSEQLNRTSLAQQQLLIGWLDLIRRIGKGTGKRAPVLRAQAAKQMRECRTAVPVWIMPLARVAEMFDSDSRFDVVIIDEASQSDVMGLVALYMGASVVVVGDHEQVSPVAVGQQLDRVSKLIDQFLEGVPNSALYDGKTSIYDLARMSFGGLICLTEHFRCYPEIIDFSNWLSYEGRIKPLREPFGANILPFVVPHRVEGAVRDEKVNLAEAAHTAALLVACAGEPEYADKTFGVVSLLGDDQAVEIEKLIRQKMTESEFVGRQVLCGNAAHFQGDERDVMFLSLVYAPDGGPLPLLTEAMYQQRFNVAASRARDQMWVVHSLDPSLHLKPKDLRRRLIEFARDPLARSRELEKKVSKTESDFERRVLEKLISSGYRVHPQYSVGAYRIDFVVEGSGRRLAVECDGEQFHTLENLDEDMARQMILERLGWKFARIRGSVFYRDPDRAMKPVFDRLAELGIEPRSVADDEGSAGTELQSRVVARAAELLREWGFESAGPVELPIPKAAECGERNPSSSASRPEQAGKVIELAAGRTTPDARTSTRSGDGSELMELTKGGAMPRAKAEPPPELVKHSPPAERSTSPVSSRRVGFMEALARRVGSPGPCPICAAPVTLRLSGYGPYLPCTKKGCGGKRSVGYDAIKAAVSDMTIVCECGGRFALRQGKTSFLGCDRYPACRKTIWWSDL